MVVWGVRCTMHSQIFGEVMDIMPDRRSGGRTTATEIGAIRAKFLIAAFLSIETAMVYWFFHDPIISGFLGVGVLWFVADSIALSKQRAYTPGQKCVFLCAVNCPADLGLYRK